MPHHYDSLKTKPRTIAILTGGNRGLGQALAEALAPRVEDLLIIGRAPAEPLGSSPPSTFIYWDMGDPQSDPFEAIIRHLHAADVQRIVFINNAATLRLGRVADEGFAADLEFSLQVNVTAPVRLISTLLAHAQEAGRELVVVHIGTGAANRPIADWGSYCISKSAMAMYVRQLAQEWPQMRCIDFDPGALATDMQRQILARSAQETAVDALPGFMALTPPAIAAERLLAMLDLQC